MKKHNFSAGPSILPEEVLEKSAQAVLNFDDGLSLVEISHRSKAFMDVMENASALALELLGLEGTKVKYNSPEILDHLHSLKKVRLYTHKNYKDMRSTTLRLRDRGIKIVFPPEELNQDE